MEQPGAALSVHGRRLIVVDPGQTRDELVPDMIDVLTSFCALLYGRGGRKRAMRAVTCAKQPPDPIGDNGA